MPIAEMQTLGIQHVVATDQPNWNKLNRFGDQPLLLPVWTRLVEVQIGEMLNLLSVKIACSFRSVV